MTKKVWYVLCWWAMGVLLMGVAGIKNDRHSNVDLVGIKAHATMPKVAKVDSPRITEATPKVVKFTSVKPSYSEVMKEIKRHRLQHPEIVFAQAVLESNHFTSPLFKRANNLFGMKRAGKRPQVYDFMSGDYIGHNVWKQSITDYALFQASFARNKTKEQYFLALKPYAADPNYRIKLQTIVSSIPKLLKQD